MKYVAAVLILAGCGTVEYVQVPNKQMTLATRADPAAEMQLKCDALGFPRASDGHRLCVMRGVDRLGVDLYSQQNLHTSPSMSHVPLIPYAYPPLAPQHAVPVVPVR